MAARQVGIYSVKGVNCTTSFESKENVRVEAIALIKGPFPFRTPGQIEKVKSNLYSQPEVKWLKAKAFKNSKRHWKVIELSGRHSISLLTRSSIGVGGGGGLGTPLYKPHRYVPPHTVGFLGLFGLKTGIDFAHFGPESGMIFEGTTGVYERICRFNSK